MINDWWFLRGGLELFLWSSYKVHQGLRNLICNTSATSTREEEYLGDNFGVLIVSHGGFIRHLMIHLAGTKKVIGMPKNVALGMLTKYYLNYLFKTIPELRGVLWKCCTWESIWEYLRLTRHVGCSPNAGVSKFVLDVSEKSGKLVSGECLQFYYKPYQWNQWVIKWIPVVCDNNDNFVKEKVSELWPQLVPLKVFL